MRGKFVVRIFLLKLKIGRWPRKPAAIFFFIFILISVSFILFCCVIMCTLFENVYFVIYFFFRYTYCIEIEGKEATDGTYWCVLFIYFFSNEWMNRTMGIQFFFIVVTGVWSLGFSNFFLYLEFDKDCTESCISLILADKCVLLSG